MPDYDDLRAQVQIYNHITTRDLAKRLAAILFVLPLVWMDGHPIMAIAIFIWLAGIEFTVFQFTQKYKDVAHIPRRGIHAILGLSLLSTAGYYLPGLMLGLSADVGFALTGFTWILAALASNFAMFNTLRAIYWSTAVVAIPVGLAAGWLRFYLDIDPVPAELPILTLAMMALYIVNTVQQLRESQDTQRELATTRARLLHSMRRLEHMTLHDELTGLQNRGAFNDALRKLLSRASKGQRVSVLMIDLNGFKSINDTFGHEAGDAVLVAVAERLAASLRQGASAFRLGGDEFAVLVAGMTDAELQSLGDRLIQQVRAPVFHEDKSLTLGASIGISVAEKTDVSPERLCSEADQAMYQAKSTKSARALFFDPASQTNMISDARRLEIEKALRAGQFIPYYQPRFALADASRVGFQALARWDHPEQGILAPRAFLEDMTHLGLLRDLLHGMLSEVLADIAAWRAAGFDPGRVSVNVPVVALATETGREELDWLIARHPDCVKNLAFEITEDAYVARSGDIVAASVDHFRALGIEIHLDDFGTGHASYQHLRHLTPDVLKVDDSLVAELGSGSPADVVIAGFLSIARGLDAAVIAEGVETEAQRRTLAEMGCDFAEGLVFAPPMPAADVISDLAASAPRSKSA